MALGKRWSKPWDLSDRLGSVPCFLCTFPLKIHVALPGEMRPKPILEEPSDPSLLGTVSRDVPFTR